MCRRATLICLLLVSSLLASGWSSVLAAALCKHQSTERTLAAGEHDCCPARLEPGLEHSESHCGAESLKPSMQAGMAMDEDAEDAAAVSSSSNEVEAATFAPVKQEVGACLHCTGRLGPQSVVAVRAPEQKKKHDGGSALPLSTVSFEARPLSFVRPPSLGSHAPPGPNIARHLSFCVLLI